MEEYALLSWCARAFSFVKKDLPLQEPKMLSYDTPLWHFTLFQNP